MQALGEKPFRAGQIYDWLHVKLADSFDEMTNLSKDLRRRLEEEYEILRSSWKSGRSRSWTARTNSCSVCMTATWWRVCSCGISTGIPYAFPPRRDAGWDACSCASTIGGLKRDLSASEMLGQIYQIQKITKERGAQCGRHGQPVEPLDNYDNFLRFVRMLTREHGLNISQRKAQCPPAALSRKCWSWRRKNSRSRSRSPCTARPRRSAGGLCPWRINTNCPRCSRHVDTYFERQDAG